LKLPSVKEKKMLHPIGIWLGKCRVLMIVDLCSLVKSKEKKGKKST